MSINLAIAGLGNCASSLLQGIEYYKKTKDTTGIMHEKIGKYRVEDIKICGAFDISKSKVGKDVSEAIFAKPNCTYEISKIERTGVTVKKGPVLDGISETTMEMFDPSDEPEVNVAEELRQCDADIMINYLPVGSQKAAEHYANACLEANVALINAIPVFIASNPEWEKKFAEKKIPIVGDDIKSQLGATILHRNLMRLFADRGIKIENSYQLNFGGNTDFLNMLDRARLKSKKISKTESVQSQLDERMSYDNLHIGPSDYVPFLKDRKIAFVRIEGRNFANAPVIFEGRLQVEDSPNSAGVMIDAIRMAKIAKDNGMGGVLKEASAYFMKHPPVQMRDETARKELEAWIEHNG